MNFASNAKKCNACGLYLQYSEFHRNKSKSDGHHNRCKDCMFDYKKKLAKGLIEKQQIIKKGYFFVPDIYLVGFGRSQVYQVCCLSCTEGFFCLNEFKSYTDLFCDDCEAEESKITEQNISSVNFVGHVVGWLCKYENPLKKRNHRNYKNCYKRDKYTCQYCGYNMQNAKKFLPLHIDHIKPWSGNGGNSLNNLVVACQECNQLVSNKWFNTFQEKKEFILTKRKIYV